MSSEHVDGSIERSPRGPRVCASYWSSVHCDTSGIRRICGEAIGSVGISTLLSRTGTPVRAMQSFYLNWSDFRTQNLILLAQNEANKWLDPVLERLPLRLAQTEGDKPRRIINTSPTAANRLNTTS